MPGCQANHLNILPNRSVIFWIGAKNIKYCQMQIYKDKVQEHVRDEISLYLSLYLSPNIWLFFVWFLFYILNIFIMKCG